MGTKKRASTALFLVDREIEDYSKEDYFLTALDRRDFFLAISANRGDFIFFEWLLA